jgi:hypothetical protein
MTVQVTFKFGDGKQLTEEFSGISLSEFIYQAPEWDIDFDTISKIEVVK